MGRYLGDKPYDLAIMVFEGSKTGDEAFDAIKSIEARTDMKIHDAAVFTRSEKGTIKLKNKGYIAGWKGGAIGLGIGILLGGPVGGALVGTLIGFGRGNERRNLRGLLNERLGITESALAIVLENTDRWAVENAMKGLGAEVLYTELQGETLAKLEELAEDDEVTAEAEEAFEELETE